MECIFCVWIAAFLGRQSEVSWRYSLVHIGVCVKGRAREAGRRMKTEGWVFLHRFMMSWMSLNAPCVDVGEQCITHGELLHSMNVFLRKIKICIQPQLNKCSPCENINLKIDHPELIFRSLRNGLASMIPDQANLRNLQIKKSRCHLQHVCPSRQLIIHSFIFIRWIVNAPKKAFVWIRVGTIGCVIY